MRHRSKLHWFTIQRNDLTIKDSTGALNRSTGWRTIKLNVRCHIQQVNKGDALVKYDIKVAQFLYVIMHNEPDLSPDESYRFIINVNPLLRIDNFPDKNEIKILEFKGASTGVISKLNRHSTNDIYAEHNKRWTL